MMWLLLALTLAAPDPGWIVDHPRPGVTVLRNEAGGWGGLSMGVAHQNTPTYRIRKTLDLSALPEGTLAGSKSARIRIWLCLQDYSFNVGDHVADGLDEQFELLINGHQRVYPTSDPRLPGRSDPKQPLTPGWVDFDVPVAELQAGANVIELAKLPDGGQDDYLYPGIDNAASYGTSATSMDGGQTWSTSKLNAIDAQGEFMIRLVLSDRDLAGTATWQPAGSQDADGAIAFAESVDRGLWLEPRLETLAPGQAIEATIRHTGATPTATWLDPTGKPLPTEREPGQGSLLCRLPVGRHDVGGLKVTAPDGGQITSATLSYELSTLEPEPVIDLNPAMAAPKGQRTRLAPGARLTADRAELTCNAFRAVFRTRPGLVLESFTPAELARNVVARPEQVAILRVKVGEEVLTASDLKVDEVKEDGRGFVATGMLGTSGLLASVGAKVDDDELRLSCEVTNASDAPLDFHLSFPSLGGLELSDAPGEDYYLFPYTGGVIANVDTELRSAYGENTCWWQMIDLFSPSGGAGIYLRADDPTGAYKIATLRKGKRPTAGYGLSEIGRANLDPAFLWTDSLPPDSGLSIAFDYLRRTRRPGMTYRPPDGCLGTHAGNGLQALERYADWSHRTWPPRPFPSKLTDRWRMIATGWGQSPLYKADQGGYSVKHLDDPTYDVDEMMSWWSWSDEGPWHTPMDQLEEQLGKALFERYKSYWVAEPVSGKLMYPLNRGDYDGYMPQWGGLDALRAHIEAIRGKGVLPTFYMEGILACANTKVGSQYGPQYGVINPRWVDGYRCPKNPAGYVASYGSYNMCADTAWWPAYLADAVARVCRESGIDGVRLDEYGHRGYVCENPKHTHLFAEPGHNGWMQGVARACRLVHRAMDDVRPDLVLTTEFPGNDHLAATLEGAITYETSSHVQPIRPAPLNLFRFYWPACKLYDLESSFRRQGTAWKLWNAAGVFGGRGYPQDVHAMLEANTEVFEGKREPLVETLVRQVYANRFSGGGKVIYTIHNATGYTLAQDVIALPTGPQQTAIDLVTGEPATVVDGKLRVRLARDETIVIGLVPR